MVSVLRSILVVFSLFHTTLAFQSQTLVMGRNDQKTHSTTAQFLFEDLKYIVTSLKYIVQVKQCQSLIYLFGILKTTPTNTKKLTE